ncbi:MAG: hypothetical protein N3A62_09105 [Thermodesulfovibrionales bacterium]|nr:hypothetical protein [Thermodesulfovibrionales bacterium]
MKTQFCISALVLFFLIPTVAFAGQNEAYEAAKESFEKLNTTYSMVKNTVDETYEVFARFNNGVRTWRNAVTRETQNMGIEEIDKLADDKIEAVIDKLFDKAKEAIGIPDGIELEIPESMKEKAIEKLRNKLKGYIPPKVVNRLGYMYTLSALDRKLRDNNIYSNLEYLKSSFDKGAKLLGNFKNAIKFIDTFSPRSTIDSPVGRLKNVKDFLGMIGDIAKPIPLMGTIINNYAKATDAFMTALNDLDNKLKEARQGSLCGQGGVDRDIQDFFERTYPTQDCLTYFALPSSEYPQLNPIRAWRGNYIFVWFEGNGTMVRESDFEILYRAFSSLTNNYTYRQLVNHGLFYNLIKSSHYTNVRGLASRAKEIHKRFMSYEFSDVLKMEGFYKDDYIDYFVAPSGNAYRLLLDADEFVGLYFFSKTFKDDVESLYNKYKNAFVINGTIKPETPNMSIANISVFVDNQPPKELKCAEFCTLRHVVYNGRYNIRVVAEGFKDVNKTFQNDRYPLVMLSMSSLKIEADKKNVTVGQKVILTAILEGRVAQTGRFYWSINGKPYGSNTNRIEFVPTQSGIYKANLTLADDRGRIILQADYSINVIEQLTLYIQGPSEVQRDVETTFYAQVKGGLFSQDKGIYTYSWQLNGQQYGGNDNFIKVRFNKEGSQSIKTTLWQWIKEQNKWQKVTEASHYLVVKSAQQVFINVTITGPTNGYIGNDFVFYANIENPQRLREIVNVSNPQTAFRWRINNSPYGGTDGSQRIRFENSGKHTISVIAWVWNPSSKNWIKIGEANHIFEAFSRQYTDRRYTLKPIPTPTPTPTQTPTPKSTPTPTPTPKVRQFSELSPQEQKEVLNCLCRCNSTATSSVSVYYDTKPDNHSPSCSDLKNGPCVNKGFGCWRHVPQNTGQCAERCYKSHNVHSVPSSYMNAR